MKIIACIVTYNRLALLMDCVHAIRIQTRKPDAVLVVDNASSDGSGEWLRNQSDLIVITQDNLGSAGGQYTCVKTGFENGYDWMWCMDDDVAPEPDALLRCVDFLTSTTETIAGVSCARVDGKTGSFLGGETIEYNPNRFRLTRRRRLAPLSLFEAGEPFKAMCVTFEGFLISSCAVKAIGLPDPRYFLQFEDFEYSLRLNRVGSIYVIPGARMRRLLPTYKRVFQSEAAFAQYLYYCRNNLYFALHGESLSTLARVYTALDCLKALYYLSRDGWRSPDSYLTTIVAKLRALWRTCRCLFDGAFCRLGRIPY